MKDRQDADLVSNTIEIEQAQTRADKAEARTELAETRIEQAETRTEQAETRTEQAKTRTEQAETRTEQAETRTELAETRVEQIEAQTDLAIQASRALLAAIVESSEDAIVGKDLNGVISSWNAGAEKIFGYLAGEIVGSSIMRLIPLDRQDEEKRILDKIKRGERVQHFETVRQAKDGRLVDVSVRVSPIKDSTGKVIGASKVARDITERKAAEEKIRQLNVELEQRVAERTAELQAANKELEAFSYSVSHDLRAPLRHVAGFVELLKREAGPVLSEKGLRHLETISSSAQRMGILIDDLLAFSKIGRSEMQKSSVDLNSLVEETLIQLEGETKEREITWKIATLPEVKADCSMMRQVLVNLITNAVKFTRTRNPAQIEIGCTTDENGRCVFFIRDNGVGFDPQYADKLFGVFQRLHSQAEFEGTGIGLANVQRIIQRHGGRVWAEGAVNGGAAFYFSLPQPMEK